MLRSDSSSWALLRLPTYRFRPAHADPMHFDLWHQGVNLLRDGGSFAYNSPSSSSDLAVFVGIASHNTVQFDGKEPMTRLGRFLWGDWLQLEASPQLELSSIAATYRSPQARHKRRVQVDDSGLCWTITDICSGFQSRALLRWRLCPGEWRLNDSSLIGAMAKIRIHCNQPIAHMDLIMGWESRLYGAKTPLPVLEVSVANAPAIFTTSIQLLA